MTTAEKYLSEIEKNGMVNELSNKIYKWADGSLCIDFEDNSFLYKPVNEDWKIGSYNDKDNFEEYEDFVSSSY